MKIAVNGNLIETELIWEITNIEKTFIGEFSFFSFKIKMFNNQELEIRYYMLKNSSIDELVKHHNAGAFNEHYIVGLPKYTESLNKITKFRDEIITIWSNNQSKIPKFTL